MACKYALVTGKKFIKSRVFWFWEKKKEPKGGKMCLYSYTSQSWTWIEVRSITLS